jgi:hypothetical protein
MGSDGLFKAGPSLGADAVGTAGPTIYKVGSRFVLYHSGPRRGGYSDHGAEIWTVECRPWFSSLLVQATSSLSCTHRHEDSPFGGSLGTDSLCVD